MDRHSGFFRRWFAAFNAHDLDALCEMLDPDVYVVPLYGGETVTPGATFHGPEGFRSLMEPAFRRWPSLRIEPGGPVPIANHVVVPLTIVLEDGVEQHNASVYALSGDRLTLIHAYETLEEACASVGHAVALSRREREIVSMLAGGLTAEEIASRLVLSVFTVRTHIRNAKDKLGARTTAQAIAIAIRDREVTV